MGPGGFTRSVSFTMAWRYLRFLMSDSCTHLSLPTWRSNSSWAAFKTLGLFRSKESAHVRVIAVLSLPVRLRTCHKKEIKRLIKLHF